jgi:hypothetical protein
MIRETLLAATLLFAVTPFSNSVVVSDPQRSDQSLATLKTFLETAEELRNYSKNGYTTTFTGEFRRIPEDLQVELNRNFPEYKFHIAKMSVQIDPPHTQYDLVVITSSVFLVGAVRGHSVPQTQAVRILQFEVDGRRIEKKFKIVLYVGNQAIEPTMKENSFVIPPSVRKQESVGVRFLCGNYNLFFDHVAVSSFDVDWIMGIDHEPFKQEYVEAEEAKKLKLLYYISFVPKDADGSRLVVKVFK